MKTPGDSGPTSESKPSMQFVAHAVFSWRVSDDILEYIRAPPALQLLSFLFLHETPAVINLILLLFLCSTEIQCTWFIYADKSLNQIVVSSLHMELKHCQSRFNFWLTCMTYKMYIYKYLLEGSFCFFDSRCFLLFIYFGFEKHIVFISICHKADMANHLNFKPSIH